MKYFHKINIKLMKNLKNFPNLQKKINQKKIKMKKKGEIKVLFLIILININIIKIITLIYNKI